MNRTRLAVALALAAAATVVGGAPAAAANCLELPTGECVNPCLVAKAVVRQATGQTLPGACPM